MKIVHALLVLPALLSISACGTITPPAPDKTSLEIQSVQARTFDTSMNTAFRSVVSVLQDMGYVIQAANLDTGFISAQSPTQEEGKSPWELVGVLLGGASADVRKEGRTHVTASVEDFNENQARVRLNFVNRVFRSGTFGQQATNETPIHDPKVYEVAFEKIGEAIFIRTAQR